MSDRFFCKAIPDAGDFFALTGKELHHLRTVMRKTEGTEIEVIDGAGTIALCRIVSLRKRLARLQVVTRSTVPRLRSKVDVAFALPGTDQAMDLIMRYITIADVSVVIPLISRRSSQMSRTRMLTRRRRWERIAAGVCKQCGRLWFPEIEMPLTLETCLSGKTAQYSMIVGGWEPRLDNALSVHDLRLDSSEKPILWIVGPEGGWAQHDLELLTVANVVPVRLGRLTWTQPLAVLSGIIALRCLLRDF